MDAPDSNQNKSTEEKHPLLDQDCKHYLEQAIEAQDAIIDKIEEHDSFLLFWYSALREKASAHNAMLFAFNFYNPEITKLEDDQYKTLASKASDYFANLRKAYNSCNKTISQFIKSFQSKNPYEKISVKDIDWHKEINPEYSLIADEMQFAWAFARLWQLLESREKGELVIRFLQLYKTSDIQNIDHSTQPYKADSVPSNVRESLKKTSPESDEFFDSTIIYFDPDYLNEDELCSYLKKACISMLSKKSRSQSTRKPLDTIWLLARFYLTHYYSLKFILGEKRGLSDRFIKQVETLQNPLVLEKFDITNLEKFKHERIKWGNKQLNFFEILASIKGTSFLNKLIKMSKEIIVGKERNPFESIISNWKKIKSKDSSLDKIDFSSPQYATLLKEKPILFNTLYIAIAIIGDMESFLKSFSSGNDDTNDEKFEDFGYMSLWITHKARQYLEHEKNLSLITVKDIDITILILVVAIWALFKTYKQSQTAKAPPLQLKEQ